MTERLLAEINAHLSERGLPDEKGYAVVLRYEGAHRNGFVIADLTPEQIILRYFRWNAHRDTVDSIDSIEPFRTAEYKRPA